MKRKIHLTTTATLVTLTPVPVLGTVDGIALGPFLKFIFTITLNVIP